MDRGLVNSGVRKRDKEKCLYTLWAATGLSTQEDSGGQLLNVFMRLMHFLKRKRNRRFREGGRVEKGLGRSRGGLEANDQTEW